MSLLNDLYRKRDEIHIEINFLKKEISKGRKQQQKIQEKVLSKKLEEEQLRGLLQIRDEEAKRRTRRSRESIKPEIIPPSEGGSSRGRTRKQPMEERPDIKTLQEDGGENRPRGRGKERTDKGDKASVKKHEKTKHREDEDDRNAYYIKRNKKRDDSPGLEEDPGETDSETD